MTTATTPTTLDELLAYDGPDHTCRKATCHADSLHVLGAQECAYEEDGTARWSRTILAADLVGQLTHGHECSRCGQPSRALEVIHTWSGRTQVDVGCACGEAFACDFPVGGLFTICELNARWTYVVEGTPAAGADVLGVALDAQAMAACTGSVASTYDDGRGTRVQAIRVPRA